MYKIVTPQYFMDSMKDYEVDLYMDNIQFLDVNQWEQARFLGYCNVQVNSKKKISPQDLLTFEWDNESGGETEISNQDIERLKTKAEFIQKQLYGKEL